MKLRRRRSAQVKLTMPPDMMAQASRAGLGLAYVDEWMVADDIASGRLVVVLSEWTPSYPGYCLYYPGRRHTAASLRAFVDLAQETISATPRRAWSVGFLIGLTIGRRSARWRPISVASSTFRPTPPKMDRAILSYSPPLRHLVARRRGAPPPQPWHAMHRARDLEETDARPHVDAPLECQCRSLG